MESFLICVWNLVDEHIQEEHGSSFGNLQPRGTIRDFVSFFIIIQNGNHVINYLIPWFWEFDRYLDEDLQVGRDGKGNVFVLERT